MRFRNMYDTDFKREFTFSGEEDALIYSPSIDNEGRVTLEVTGKRNIRDFIDSFRDSCDINNIVARFNAGDSSALSRSQGAFFDATQLPHTYAEMLNTVINAEQTFNQLPLEVRERFENNYVKWISMMDDAEKFAVMMGVSHETSDDTFKGDNADD